ncbi:NUDIX domain-containing protein [Alginatibacterium sediminis]|uniref:NUDIX domain-containing protein n=1 Tax=Alginatibacterium sediminis TaxID=2164068 RepID=A0A420ECX3_9ALTE|nr:NUDIX hydrolase [Alginatibacterium sediminis]RKF18530.1 NUDIX domain-containing protein [Alginatibacterium sediminis]
MQLLQTTIHPDVTGIEQPHVLRQAARAIILDGESILLLYTERYHDYTLPGGGIDAGESIENGLIRELEEETGAKHIEVIKPFGRYDEYRPWHKDQVHVIYMQSYCYICDIHPELGETKLENHEIQNGMRPVWVNIHQAIAHNLETMANSTKKGLSIERETFLLKRIVNVLLDKAA